MGELAGLSTPEGRIAFATRWLVEHRDAPLVDRVACAVVVASGGDIDGPCTFGEVAHYAGDDVTPTASTSRSSPPSECRFPLLASLRIAAVS